MSDELRQRTKAFALKIIQLTEKLPTNKAGQVLGKQVLRSGTSVGAQYREACRAKSDADFISKVEGSLQELDETGYWLELIEGSRLAPAEIVHPLTLETEELTAIFVTIVKKVKARKSP